MLQFMYNNVFLFPYNIVVIDGKLVRSGYCIPIHCDARRTRRLRVGIDRRVGRMRQDMLRYGGRVPVTPVVCLTNVAFRYNRFSVIPQVNRRRSMCASEKKPEKRPKVIAASTMYPARKCNRAICIAPSSNHTFIY